MADNAQKTPIQQTLNAFADKKINNAAQLLGKSVPASVLSTDPTNTIVTVKLELQETPFTFPQITCPVYGPQWLRWPIQTGDLGVCFASDYYLGGMSGLGGGVASLTQMMNLGTLVWFPIGNASFSATDNKQAAVLYGPDGSVIRTQDSSVKMVLDKEGVKFFIGSQVALVIDSGGVRAFSPDGSASVVVENGGTKIDNINFLPHVHSGVQTGSNDTGGVAG